MHVLNKGDGFLIYFFPHQMLCHNNMRSHFNTMITTTCLKRKMSTPCQIINHMITWLILKNVCNLNLNPFTICHKINLWLFINISIKNLKKKFVQHSKFPTRASILFIKKKSQKKFVQHSKFPTRAPILFIKKKVNLMWMCVNYLLWFELIYHEEPIPFTFDLKVVESIKSCQDIHKD